MIRISVIDSGVGIAQENHSKIFKLFGACKNLNKKINVEGIGLGLMISKMIVEEFKGNIGF